MRQPTRFLAALIALSFASAATVAAPRSAAPGAARQPSTRPPTRPAASTSSAQSAATAERAGTMEDIRKLFDEGKYPEVLRAIGRVLPLKGRAAEGFDRYELLALKAETHLRMGSAPNAATTWGQAAEAADEQKDAQKAAVARATQMLLKRAKGTDYVPRVAARGAKKPDPIDILDPEKRKDALKAMYADDKAAADPKIKAGLRARTLPPIAEATEAAHSLSLLETAVNGSDTETKESLTKLGERGKELLNKELDRITAKVDQIGKTANTVKRVNRLIPVGNGQYQMSTITFRQGLQAEDLRYLKETQKTLPQFATNARGLARASGGEEADADETVGKVDDLMGRIKDVLNDDYSQ